MIDVSTHYLGVLVAVLVISLLSDQIIILSFFKPVKAFGVLINKS